jgi:two-component system, OmpR family, response regulator
MMAFSRARVVVVCTAASDCPLVDAINRMGLSSVRVVAGHAEAQRVCDGAGTDACLVVLPPEIPDEAPQLTAEIAAPGGRTGVPSLLFADVVTPYLTKSARRSGYVAAVPLGIPSRLLYRRLGSLLQKARRSAVRSAAGQQAIRSRLRRRMGEASAVGAATLALGKPKLQ